MTDKNKRGVLRRSLYARSLLLFLVVWFAYGAAINSNNLSAFDLQQIGVEAMVERHHFYLEGSASPGMQTKGDVFEYNGHLYAAKQPGQFMACAIAYAVLHLFGFSYAKNYLLTAALVTFFTTSLVLAASAVVVFKLAGAFTRDSQKLFWPLAATFSYTIATTAFAYSGIAHHDALATGYLVIAFYLIFKLSHEAAGERVANFTALASGLLLGVTITTSMLPFFMTIVCAVYFLSLRRWRLVPWFATGLFTGLLPLFVYDAVSFGNPLRLANVAGAAMFADTFWHFDPRNLGIKMAFYAKALAIYAPVFAAGLFGFSYFPRALKIGREFSALIVMMVLSAVYVFNIPSDGDCQFGPRYLLPWMPIACLGLVGYSFLSRSSEQTLASVLVLLTVAVSFVVNLIGALGGAMNCPHGENALKNRALELQAGEMPSYPLGRWLLLPLLICAALLVWNLIANRDRHNKSIASAH